MDTAETSQLGRKVTFVAEMKTDLKLLLECLKFQMDKPGCQKETLAAVRSICQDNIEACDYFREIGGLTFLNNLSKSSSHSILKEASLYTLAVLAESNVYCQQTLCTSALFEDVHTILSDEQSSINLKRMCVYIFLVLVSNNKTGQSLARVSGCVDILLFLFSKMLTCNMVLAGGSTNPQYQLWSSVCSALCACVNNPQNEENQKLCSTAFPQASERLRGSLHHEIARPICSLIGLTVANSRFAQDYFASIGGLNILSDVLSDLVNGLQVKSCDSKLAIVVTKTLDACIAENSKSVHHLSKHNILSSLMNLLSCATLEPEDKFSIVLTVGHLTDDCEANQYELLKSNGLPLMIQVLAESQDDELHKAATYVLQNCRCITETLSLDLNKHNPNLSSATSDNNQRGKYLDEYWGKAAEIFHKIQYLQQQYNEDINGIEGPDKRDNVNTAYKKSVVVSMPQAPGLVNNPKYRDDHPIAAGCPGDLQSQNHITTQNTSHIAAQGFTEGAEKSQENVRQQIHLDANKHPKFGVSTSGQLSKTYGDYVAEESCADLLSKDQSSKPDSSRNNITSRDAVTHVIENLHNNPPLQEPSGEPMHTSPPAGYIRNLRVKLSKQSTSVGRENFLDPMMICADLIHKEINKVVDIHCTLRCSGCLVAGYAMTSRNCSNILMGCPHLCDRHRVILQAEERFRSEYRKLLYGTGSITVEKSVRLTPLRRGEANVQNITRSTRILLTPTRKVNEKGSHCTKTASSLQGVESKCDKGVPTKRQEITHNEPHAFGEQPSRSPEQNHPQKGTRKDFTQIEIAYLLDGVEKFGHHWNAILWSYPFQKGRRNVDLAKKYKHLEGQH
ncbi:telomere repeats-binding bouquet formation protein 1 [Engystomops pustulosus]|uniref:telomere repeats-binding bouquet formation protein 1 n=1 Tax=Engystomops pustulosus TaxID=76066 RepID=UPI003AFA2476